MTERTISPLIQQMFFRHMDDQIARIQAAYIIAVTASELGLVDKADVRPAIRDEISRLGCPDDLLDKATDRILAQADEIIQNVLADCPHGTLIPMFEILVKLGTP